MRVLQGQQRLKEIGASSTRSGGFALVELLVATSLMALTGGATIAAISGGLRVWERATELGTRRQSVLIAFDRLRRDLQNVRRFKLIPFTGRYDRYTFATAEQSGSDDEAPIELGLLGVFLDERWHRLCRSFTPYRLMREEEIDRRCQTVLEDVVRVRFKYFGMQEDGNLGWSDQWEANEAPMAMQSEILTTRDRRTNSSQTLVVYLSGTLPHR